MRMTELRWISMCLCLVSLSACLKTRAQLREESDGPSDARTVPAQIQEVEPKGQYVLDEVKAELTRLTGRIEDLERNQQAGVTSKLGDDQKKLEKRVQELEQAQATLIEQLKKMQTVAADASAPEAFERGKSQLAAQDLEGAVQSFTDYLKSPKPRHAEEATFLRAEALYELKQYNRAVTDYAQFPERFNRSKYMPQALYKIGMSFLALHNKSDARAFFSELIEKFPKSPEAKKAKGKLK